MQELKRLDEDANVFKLIGPALIRQDLVEAKSNVSKRIEYIKAEMDRSDSQLKSLESKNKEKEGEVRYKPMRMPWCSNCGNHSFVHCLLMALLALGSSVHNKNCTQP